MELKTRGDAVKVVEPVAMETGVLLVGISQGVLLAFVFRSKVECRACLYSIYWRLSTEIEFCLIIINQMRKDMRLVSLERGSNRAVQVRQFCGHKA